MSASRVRRGRPPHVEAHGRRHRPDLLGYGRSPRPASGYGPNDHVRALLTCLDERDVSEPATICGHSLGGLIAIRLAATHPDRVNGVVAFGPPLYPDRQSALAHVGGTSPMGRLFVLPGRTAEIACRWVCDHRAVAAKLAVLTHPGLPPSVAADGVQQGRGQTSTLQFRSSGPVANARQAAFPRSYTSDTCSMTNNGTMMVMSIPYELNGRVHKKPASRTRRSSTEWSWGAFFLFSAAWRSCRGRPGSVAESHETDSRANQAAARRRIASSSQGPRR
jgi:pimeloyl-ACP methyl ester carboxylesterase